MQPYFFPYIGYWQLIHAVDRFVIYDDVNYIKGGWINRNRILINGQSTYITVPLNQPSPNRRICDTTLLPSTIWRDKMVKMVEITYRKSAFFSEVFPVVEGLIRYETDSLSNYLAHHLQTLTAFMGIRTDLVVTSRCYENNELSGQERIIDICKREKATTYINPQGGQTLYDSEAFRKAGINLRFIIMRPFSYQQRSSGFVQHLSIIDVLMEVGADGIRQHLDAVDLIGAA